MINTPLPRNYEEVQTFRSNPYTTPSLQGVLPSFYHCEEHCKAYLPCHCEEGRKPFHPPRHCEEGRSPDEAISLCPHSWNFQSIVNQLPEIASGHYRAPRNDRWGGRLHLRARRLPRILRVLAMTTLRAPKGRGDPMAFRVTQPPLDSSQWLSFPVIARSAAGTTKQSHYTELLETPHVCEPTTGDCHGPSRVLPMTNGGRPHIRARRLPRALTGPRNDRWGNDCHGR